jgi:hypothetical protein
MKAKTSVANKRSPSLPSVTVSTDAMRVEFSGSSPSNLGELLRIASNMPSVRYDPSRGGHVIDLTARQKSYRLFEIDSSIDALLTTVEQFGTLMAGVEQDYLDDHHGFKDLGFTISGLAHMANQLLCARGEIDEATPIREDISEAVNG